MTGLVLGVMVACTVVALVSSMGGGTSLGDVWRRLEEVRDDGGGR
jgi:hypothetical protein